MDRSVFKDRLYSKIYRKKRFNFTKRKFTPKNRDGDKSRDKAKEGSPDKEKRVKRH
jgi:hypothetical protein